ncbi:hypothetical protein MPSEU_000847700 [Mayamaea pseudoterrestris]|nr:hypothetical protein MPSEU_000847700 [Mayamaea pseudoterrestris]
MELNDGLNPPLRQFLTRVTDPEELPRVAHRWVRDADGNDENEEGAAASRPLWDLPVIPVYKLNDGFELWQLALVDADSFWMLFANEEITEDEDLIICITSDIGVIFGSTLKRFKSLRLVNNNGDKFVKLGPRFVSYVGEESRNAIFEGELFVLHSSGVRPSTDKLQLCQKEVQNLLRLATRFPLPRRILPGTDHGRRLELYGKDSNNAQTKPLDMFSAECLRECFGQADWKRNARLTLSNYPLSAKEWNVLQEFTFKDLRVSGHAPLSWTFLQNTKAESIQVHDDPELERDFQNDASPVSTRIVFRPPYLLQVSGIDGFCRKWLSIASDVELEEVRMSETSWQYLWQSNVLLDRTSWTSIRITDLKIGRKNMEFEDARVIPADRPWTLKWFAAKDDESNGSLLIRRIVPSFADEEMSYSRRDASNPLVRDAPPPEASQSVVLAAMLAARNDPDRLYRLCRSYAHMLTKPRTSATRLSELETGLIELRTLGMDHDATIALVMQVMNAQQFQHDRELQQMGEQMQQALEQQRVASARELQQMREQMQQALWQQHVASARALQQALEQQRVASARELQQALEQQHVASRVEQEQFSEQLHSLVDLNRSLEMRVVDLEEQQRDRR